MVLGGMLAACRVASYQHGAAALVCAGAALNAAVARDRQMWQCWVACMHCFVLACAAVVEVPACRARLPLVRMCRWRIQTHVPTCTGVEVKLECMQAVLGCHHHVCGWHVEVQHQVTHGDASMMGGL